MRASLSKCKVLPAATTALAMVSAIFVCLPVLMFDHFNGNEFVGSGARRKNAAVDPVRLVLVLLGSKRSA